MQFALLRAEARAILAVCPDKPENNILTKWVCPSNHNISIMKKMIRQVDKYGIESVNISYKDGVTKPKYYMIDTEGYENDIPEKLYRYFFWKNYLFFGGLSLLMFYYMYKIYREKIIRYDIEKLGYKQEMLYPEIGINKRKSSKTSESDIFDIMDYLIPNVTANEADEYVKKSLKISLKGVNENFKEAGKRAETEYIEFLKKFDALRIEAYKSYEKDLAANTLFKLFYNSEKKEFDPFKFEKFYKEYNSWEKNYKGADNSFVDYVRKQENNPSITATQEELKKMEYWMNAKTSNLLYIGLLNLNMVSTNRDENKLRDFEFGSNEINGVQEIYRMYGYDKNHMCESYNMGNKQLVDAMTREPSDTKKYEMEKVFKSEHRAYLKYESEYLYKKNEHLDDYISYKKFYQRPTRINIKNKPYDFFKEMSKETFINDYLLEEKNPKRVALEKKLATHYYKDDLGEQYGRILPLPVYIMTPISPKDRDQLSFRKAGTDGKKFTDWGFKAQGANIFLKVMMDRILFSFESAIDDTIKMMEKDRDAKGISDEDRDTIEKLIAETKKMKDPSELQARRGEIDKLLKIHRFEETFLIGLLEYGRKILNLPVGNLSAHTKKLNPALFYAITSVGRTYTYNVSFPIVLMYEFEKRHAKDKIAKAEEEALKEITSNDDHNELGSITRNMNEMEPEPREVSTSHRYPKKREDKVELDPRTGNTKIKYDNSDTRLGDSDVADIYSDNKNIESYEDKQFMV